MAKARRSRDRGSVHRGSRAFGEALERPESENSGQTSPSPVGGGADSEATLSLLVCGVLLLSKPSFSQLDFSKDTPHNSTHPNTTFRQ